RHQTAVCAGLLFLALVLCFTPIHKEYSGLARVADVILESSTSDYPSVLIVSDAAGEGMFVADMAPRQQESKPVVIRATKTLSNTNWLGTEYENLCSNPREVVDRLDEMPITYVVVDRSVRPDALFPHQKLLDRAIADHPAFFQQLGAFNATRNGVQYPDSVYLYRFVHSRTPDRVLRLSMLRMLHSEIDIVVPM